MIDGYATQAQYIEHLAPILLALPDDRRGTLYVELNHNELGPLCDLLGLRWSKGRPPFDSADPVVIAAGANLQPGYSSRPVVFVEHGAGQQYVGADSAAYTGGMGREMVRLFLGPNERTCATNLARYPEAEAVAIGDPTIRNVPCETSDPVIAFSFHWNASIGVPEADSTWPYWRHAIESYVARSDREIIGHAHPRMTHVLRGWWASLGVPFVERFEDVKLQASLYVCDNSSTLFEFAALDRPVMVLDAPQYRRDVEHGGRFWDWADVGYRLGDLTLLGEAIEVTLGDMDNHAFRRREIVAEVYAALGDDAATLAREAILARWP